jgi:hypothetical protein
MKVRSGAMANGNGKVDPRVITAQQCVEAALKPLRDAEKRAATTKLRLSGAETVLAVAEQAYDKAQSDYVDDDSHGNKQKLHTPHAEVQAAKSRVDGFKRKLATEEAAIVPLRAEHDATMVALAQIQLEANLTHLEEVWSVSRDAVVKLEEQLVKARQVAWEDEQRFKTLAAQKRNAEQNAAQILSRERFRIANPKEPGFQRTRRVSDYDFGL